MADIFNRTKYHLKELSFKVGDWAFEFDKELNANAYLTNYNIENISLSNGTFCFEQASYLAQNLATAGVFDCTMPGIAEGDCQELVEITSTFDDAAINRIREKERVAGAQQLQPVREAIAKAGLATNTNNVSGQIPPDRQQRFSDLLDSIVASDSQFWGFNKYQRGSMGFSQYAPAGPNAGFILRGFYKYTRGDDTRAQLGWVEALIKDGAVGCIRFHDFPDDCRALRLPDVKVDAQ